MESNKELKDERELQEFHKKSIIEIVDNIDSTEYLKFLHNLMLSFQKKWGI